MGIKNLQPFIRKTCPHVYRECSLEHYAFKKVAVDVSIYLCKFKTTYGKQWLDALLQFITTLREFDIHPVFIFDTEFPVEKDAEKKSRQLQRLKTREKVEHLTKMWEQLKNTFQEHQTTFFFSSPHEFQELQDLYSKICPEWNVSLSISICSMDQEIEKINNSMLSIRSDDYLVTKELLDILQVPYFQAVGEAEATCSALCRYHWVDAVMSEDTDVLAYGAPVFLHRMNFMTKTVIEIQYQELIHGLRMTSSQFLDFCIMCGTDYNKNIPQIGPEKSYRLLQKYESLENIQRCCQHLDVSILTFPRVRELFHLELDEKHWKIPFCGFPDMVQLSEFCFNHNCKVDMKVVEIAFFQSPRLVLPPHWETLSPSSPPSFETEPVQEKEEEIAKVHTLPDFSISTQPFVNYVSLLRRVSIR
uniref:XPG N-terminal domain-containing protein n=1 Tax=viral metagenome TaxID=1070528 RepID=A0A6C0D256_9ZZZZ